MVERTKNFLRMVGHLRIEKQMIGAREVRNLERMMKDHHVSLQVACLRGWSFVCRWAATKTSRRLSASILVDSTQLAFELAFEICHFIG